MCRGWNRRFPKAFALFFATFHLYYAPIPPLRLLRPLPVADKSLGMTDTLAYQIGAVFFLAVLFMAAIS